MRLEAFLAHPALEGLREALQEPPGGHVVAEGHRLLSTRQPKGVKLSARARPQGLWVELELAQGLSLPGPLHLCFALLRPRGLQRVNLRLLAGRTSRATIISHCIFPNPLGIRHLMRAQVLLQEGAELSYEQIHIHGPEGGLVVEPRAQVELQRKACYRADFALLQGRAGRLSIHYVVKAQEEAAAELVARGQARGQDQVCLREEIHLLGKASRGLIKARLALRERAQGLIEGITVGAAPQARGHVDCLEVLAQEAQGRAVPMVEVRHPLARVTHEAALGRLQRAQLEALMARGLSPQEAEEMLIQGILRK